MAQTEADRIRDLHNWPRWPWLPVKKRTSGGTRQEFGVIHADNEKEVYPGINVFQINAYFPGQAWTKITYKSVEELCVDWKVD